MGIPLLELGESTPRTPEPAACRRQRRPGAGRVSSESGRLGRTTAAPRRCTTDPRGPRDRSDCTPPINTEVEKAIHANIEKLTKAAADERHLFIWIDSTDWACFAPLSFGTLPTTRPTLAKGVDKAWVAADLRGPLVPTSYHVVGDAHRAVGIRDQSLQWAARHLDLSGDLCHAREPAQRGLGAFSCARSWILAHRHIRWLCQRSRMCTQVVKLWPSTWVLETRNPCSLGITGALEVSKVRGDRHLLPR